MVLDETATEPLLRCLLLLLYLGNELTDLLVTRHQTVDLDFNTLAHHLLQSGILICHHSGGTGSNFVCRLQNELLLGVPLSSGCESLCQLGGRRHQELIDLVLIPVRRSNVEQERPQWVLERTVLQHLDHVAVHDIREGVLEGNLIRRTGTVVLLVNFCCRDRQVVQLHGGLVAKLVGKHLAAP
ncbi:hypothetical protein D3C80_1348510 [compost metagenome]